MTPTNSFRTGHSICGLPLALQRLISSQGFAGLKPRLDASEAILASRNCPTRRGAASSWQSNVLPPHPANESPAVTSSLKRGASRGRGLLFYENVTRLFVLSNLFLSNSVLSMFSRTLRSYRYASRPPSMSQPRRPVRPSIRGRGVMIPALDQEPELDFQLFGDSGSRFRSSKQQNCNTYRDVRIWGLEPNPESDFQPFGDSETGFGSSKKWYSNTSNSLW